jgi:subtilisin family serine protease
MRIKILVTITIAIVLYAYMGVDVSNDTIAKVDFKNKMSHISQNEEPKAEKSVLIKKLVDRTKDTSKKKIKKNIGIEDGASRDYYDKSRLLVSYNKNSDLSVIYSEIHSLSSDVKIKQLTDDLRVLVVEFSRSYNNDVIQQINSIKNVDSVERDYLLTTLAMRQATDNFRYFSPKKRGKNKDKKIKKISAKSNLSDTKVCILDTGADTAHEDLQGISIYGKAFINGEVSDDFSDVLGHGTSITSIIASQADNIGIDGLAPSTNVCMAKVFDDDGYARLSDIILGASWAIEQSPNIINFSLGLYEDSQILRQLLKKATNKNIMLVAAAGNSAQNTAMFPAKYPFVYSVGSHDINLNRAKFSNWGKHVDIYAPGSYIFGATNRQGSTTNHLVSSGTSYSSAVVTGLLLNLLEGRDTPSKLIKQIDNSSVMVKGDHYLPAIPVINIAKLFGFEVDTNYFISDKSRNSRIVNSSESLNLNYTISSAKIASKSSSVSLIAKDLKRKLTLSTEGISFVNGKAKVNFTLPVSDIVSKLPTKGNTNQSLKTTLVIDGKEVEGSDSAFVISNKAVKTGDVVTLSLSSLNVKDSEIIKNAFVSFANTGNQPINNPKFTLTSIDAIHEGVPKGKRTKLSEFTYKGTISPEEVIRVKLPIKDFEFPELRVTFEVTVSEGDTQIEKFLQGLTYSKKALGAIPLYAQARHRDIVIEAVELLRAQGIYIPDLHDDTTYLGTREGYYEWPDVGGFAYRTEYYDDEKLASMQASYSGVDYTLIDGSHDADGIDIAFGYSLADLFDSHFWMDDSSDDDGHNVNNVNHHSALTKMKLLINGPSAIGGHSGDAILENGAIDHYKKGHKAGAWWLLGHALHLIGDLTVPSHVDDNAHGVYGSAYHDWIGNYGSTINAINRGGFIDPYQDAAMDEPVRFLAYSCQQLAGAFPWASTLDATYYGRDGNRHNGGEGKTYPDYMNTLMASLAKHPLKKWHINKDEIEYSLFGYGTGDCGLSDFYTSSYHLRRDCISGGDGIVDRDNTDSGGHDADGSLTRIAQSNYIHAVQAAAGLIYYFAKETGQLIEYTDVMPAINMLLLD